MRYLSRNLLIFSSITLVSSRLIYTRHSGRPVKLHSLLPAESALGYLHLAKIS